MNTWDVAPVTMKATLDVGLAWAVVRDPGQRTQKIVAYAADEDDARQIAEALTAFGRAKT